MMNLWSNPSPLWLCACRRNNAASALRYRIRPLHYRIRLLHCRIPLLMIVCLCAFCCSRQPTNFSTPRYSTHSDRLLTNRNLKKLWQGVFWKCIWKICTLRTESPSFVWVLLPDALSCTCVFLTFPFQNSTPPCSNCSDHVHDSKLKKLWQGTDGMFSKYRRYATC